MPVTFLTCYLGSLHMQVVVGLLQALPVLQAKFAIKRALMRLQIQVPKSCKAEAVELLAKLEAEVQSKDFSASQVSRPCPSSMTRGSKVKHVLYKRPYTVLHACVHITTAQHVARQHCTARYCSNLLWGVLPSRHSLHSWLALFLRKLQAWQDSSKSNCTCGSP